MVVAELTIVVDSCDPTRPLIPGQLISGRVICHTEEPKDFEVLTLTFSGFAHVRWIKTRNRMRMRIDNDLTFSIYCTSHQDYFQNTTLLAGGDQGSHALPAGSNSFPFQVTFPGNIAGLPSSFEGSVGHVRYQLFAHLKRRLPNSDSSTAVLFSFCAPFNLNALPDTEFIRRPVELQDEIILGCCCCKSGPISCKIFVPKQGFVPGEQLDFRGRFFNKSKSTIKHVIVKLLLKADYHADRRSRHDSFLMASFQSQPIKPGEDLYSEGPLIIPACPPTNLGVNIGIINVNYVVEFIMVPDNKACPSYLSVQMPIAIGTVPLR